MGLVYKALRKVVPYRGWAVTKSSTPLAEVLRRHFPAMSDSEERMLLDERNDQPAARSNSRTEEVSNADLFSLLKTYMNDKISGIEKTFSDTTQSLAKKVRKTENSFKFKGNQLQFELNSDLIEDINSAIKFIESKREAKAVSTLKGALETLKKRNKHIRIADKSDGGWKTVDEYLSDEVASDSQDEKRIRAAENRAVRKIRAGKKNDKTSRKRPAEAAGAPSQPVHNGGNSYTVPPFRAAGAVASAQQNSKANDQCFRCSSFGHWARECRKKLDGEKATVSRGSAV